MRLAHIQRTLSRAHPVLGRLASFLELSVEEGLGCAVASGAQALRFDTDYCRTATDEALRFWLAHAALHAALLHFAPPPGKPEVWSQACDAKVNALLRQLGLFVAQSEGLERHVWWDDLSEETGAAAQQRMGGALADVEPSAALHQSITQQWRLRVRQAVGEALGAGEADGVLLRELLGHAPQASGQDWRARLAAFLQRWHRAEAHYGRVSRRALAPFLMPALRPAAAHVLVAVDTSASIKEVQLQQFWVEIQSFAGQVTMQLTLLAADTKLAEGAPWVFAPGEVPQWPHPHGQGGTDFRPVFAWLEQYGEGVDAVIYFTDGKGDYPAYAPSVPVMWVLAGEGGDVRRPPFGEVVLL
jgi:predicted metal-dependent peptidase